MGVFFYKIIAQTFFYVKSFCYISIVIIRAMKAVLKNESALTILAVAILLILGCIVIPLLITLGCKFLLWIFTDPIQALTIIGAFTGGMILNEVLTKLEK